LEKKPTDELGSLSSDEDESPEAVSNDKDIDLNAEDETGQDDGCTLSRALNVDDESDDELNDIYIWPMEPGLRDEKELKGAKQGLYKVVWLACKLRFSSNQFRADFQLTCKEVNLPTPWNIQCDVRTHWNSTKDMVEDVVCLDRVIIAFQKTSYIPPKKRINKEEFKGMRTLL
ncbi:hypothetical protein FRC11_007175, partial [Ceratobasidium sp. 423]